MTKENKRGNAFTNNPLVKAIGSQKYSGSDPGEHYACGNT